jgi:hypothetical protein
MRARWTPGRHGLAYLDTVVASLVFALTLAGVGTTFVTQEKLMRAIEQRGHVLAPANVVVHLELGDDDHLDATVQTLADPTSIQGAAYQHLAGFAGPPPRLLFTIDCRPDHWPAAGRTLRPAPAILPDFMGNDGSTPGYTPNYAVNVVTAIDPDATTITVDQVPNQPGG